MNANVKKRVGLLLIIVVITILLAPLASAVADDEVVPATSQYLGVFSKQKPPVIPPHAKAFGKTYSQWSVEWWQWALNIPADENHPLIADGKMDCGIEQGRKVWFLGGTYDTGPDPENPEIVVGEAHRKCRVPHGKALYFPILNIICSDVTGDGTTEEELAGCANGVVDSYVYPLSATIDGLPVEDLEAYRTVSPLFSFGPLPEQNLMGAPEGTEGIGMSSGYYLLLPPLSRGKHRIEFEGKIEVPDYDGDGQLDYQFILDISYDLRVRGSGR